MTLVRFLTSVDDLVATQCTRLPETLPADLADERTRTCVDRHVSREVVMGVEDLAALLAGERLLFATCGISGRGICDVIDCR